MSLHFFWLWPGLVPGIHVFPAADIEDVDGLDEPSHDDNN
jgi:hypothetical protein